MHRILLLDDDEPLRRALRLSLQKAGYEVVEPASGLHGLMVAAQAADLIVTDMVMPGIEGVETIRTLRQLRPQLPIIAISGGGRGSALSYLQIATLLGASATLEKPFEPSDLCAAIARLLEPDRTMPPA